jgi:predicted permease
MSVLGFAISVTGPIFLVVLLGFVLRRRGVIDPAFVGTASSIVFRFGLPAILFLSVYDGVGLGDVSLNVFMVIATLFLVLLGYFQARFVVVRSEDTAVFVQGIYRGNLAVIALAFCANAYGPAGLAQAAVPMGVLTIVYNLVAVVIFGSAKTDGERRWWGTVRSVARNPLIIALVIGFVYRATNLPLPGFIADTGHYFAAMTLPLALLCIGASIDFPALRSVKTTVLTACAWKLVVSPILFTTLAWLLGWRGQSLGIVFFFSAAPTAAASYIMAKAVRGNEALAAGIVVLTTVAAVFTVTLGLFLLKTMDLI